MKTNTIFRRLLPFVLALAALFVIAGCNDWTNSPDPDPVPGPATIKIESASDEALGKYNSYHEYIHGSIGERIVISSDKTIKDFNFIAVGINFETEDISFIAEQTIHAVGELLPDKPFVLQADIAGATPRIGISFLDTDNTTKYYYIHASGYDGTPLITEFDNTNANSNNSSGSNNGSQQTDSTPAQIQIAEATDEILKKYNSFNEYIHEKDAPWLIFTTDKTVKDFNFINVHVTDGFNYTAGSTIHKVGELSSNKPFVLKAYDHHGAASINGISFLDVDNVRKYYRINTSGIDGSPLLFEFKNSN
jgi:hypothetical protein